MSFKIHWAASITILAFLGINIAEAATLRPSGTIKGGSIYLSDIFADLRPGQDRVLGAAPDPGKSIYIGGTQLIAFADQYGVDWDDQSSSSSLTLTRVGHKVNKSEYEALVKKLFTQQQASGPVTVYADEFPSLIVPENEDDPLKIEHFEWDRDSGKFTAKVMPTQSLTGESYPLKGTIRMAQAVLVYAHSLPSGHILQDSDMVVDQNFSKDIPVGAMNLPEPGQIVGMALVRGVVAGGAVQTTDLRKANLIHHGDPTLISYSVPGIRLTATGRALEDGGSGQYVHVLNLGNHMILTGKVIGTAEVRVDASATAIAPDTDEAKRLGFNAATLNALK